MTGPKHPDSRWLDAACDREGLPDCSCPRCKPAQWFRCHCGGSARRDGFPLHWCRPQWADRDDHCRRWPTGVDRPAWAWVGAPEDFA